MPKIVVFPRPTRNGSDPEACVKEILQRRLGDVIARVGNQVLFEISSTALPTVVAVAQQYDCAVREVDGRT